MYMAELQHDHGMPQKWCRSFGLHEPGCSRVQFKQASDVAKGPGQAASNSFSHLDGTGGTGVGGVGGAGVGGVGGGGNGA